MKNFLIIPAKSTKQIKLIHYPAVYRLPIGKHAVTGTIIGYGEASISINIIK